MYYLYFLLKFTIYVFLSGTGYYSYVNSISPLHSPVEEVGSAKSGSRGGVRYFHLVRPAEDASLATLTKDRTYGTLVVGNGTSTHKAVPEIFLTRLLSTKGTVQQFVDDFIRAVLSANESPPGLPAPPVAIKWLFDLLDEAAANHGVADSEVVHAWKGNCLPLRLWVTFIKNPEFAFDISKTPAVDACLGVVAQTLVDACATAEHRLGKDSPSNKLLFAKDIPKYRTQVSELFFISLSIMEESSMHFVTHFLLSELLLDYGLCFSVRKIFQLSDLCLHSIICLVVSIEK